MKQTVQSAFREQRGVASLLSVVFFILIASIVTVGFMRMALLEGRQSLEDSLSKSALAAAYSGVNDAKRAILYCNQFPVVQPECANLEDTTCPGFFGNTALRGKLGLLQNTTTGSVEVGDSALNERYTCTLISLDSFTVKGSLVRGSIDENTTLIPLRSDGSFDTVVITWQEKRPSSTLAGLDYGGDTSNASYRDSTAFSSFFRANPDWPALIGAHLIVQQAGQNIVQQADGSVSGVDQRRWMFYPSALGAPSVSVNDAPGQVSRQLTRCNSAGISPKMELGSYMCQVAITGLNSMPGSQFLQLIGLYANTDYVVELLQGGVLGTPVKFNNVNPQIDSTGAVDNVFRRVNVGLRYEGGGAGGRNPILPNAIDTGAGLCKNFTISNTDFSEDCGY